MRPFSFGIQLSAAPAGREWREAAVRAEAGGYHALLMPDHFGRQLAPFPALAAAAAATTTLRLGTLVCANDFRHPLALAKEAATLDVLSEGRFELGIGAGWAASDYTATGIAFDTASVRIDRLVEALGLIKRAWLGERFTSHGAHYAVTDYEGRPLPVQRPRPPLLIASGSPRLLGIAAREADIVALAPRPARDGSRLVWDSISTTATQAKIEWVRQAAAERLAALTLSCNVVEVEVTDDLAGAAARLAARFGCQPELVCESPHVWIGPVERIVEQLYEQRERYGISYYTVLGDLELLVAAMPVVAALAGR